MLSIVMPILIVHPVIERMTLETIDSVYKTTLGEWELILVVHGETPLHFKCFYPRVQMVYNKERMAISEAYNLGFKQAKGDIFCCLHNDVMLPFGWNHLMDQVAREGKISFPMLKEEKEFCRLRGIIPTEPWQTPACCFMFSRDLWDRLGGYDEQFKEMHGEDIDLFKRAEDMGVKLVRCDVEVYHRRGATRALVSDGGGKAFIDNWNKYYFKHRKQPGEVLNLPRVNERPEVFHNYKKEVSFDERHS